MAIRPELKDSENYQLVAGLDENDDAQELRFTGDEVNVVDDDVATAIGDVETAIAAVETDVEAAVSELQDIELDIEGIQTWIEDYDDNSANAIKVIEYEHHEIHSGSHYYIEGHTTLDDGDPVPATGTLYAKIVTPNSGKWAHFTWQISSNGILESSLWELPTGGMTGGKRATIHANNRNGVHGCFSGRQDGGDGEAILTDSTASWTVDALIGLQVFNQTDGSSGFVTDNDATTVTATLAGGTDNDWDDDDLYEINNSQLIITSGIVAPTNHGLQISDANVGGAGFKADIGGESKRADEIILRENTTYLRQFRSYSDANIVSFKASWYEHTDK